MCPRTWSPSWPGSGDPIDLQVAVVDTGPLYAAVDRDDRHHEESLDLLQMGGILPVIPTMVIAEATYIVGTRLGPEVEARFLEGLAGLDIRPPSPDDWARIGELVRRYHDLPLGGTDASVVALAERLDAELVITLDRRHFSVVRPRHRDSLTIVP